MEGGGVVDWMRKGWLSFWFCCCRLCFLLVLVDFVSILLETGFLRTIDQCSCLILAS